MAFVFLYSYVLISSHGLVIGLHGTHSVPLSTHSQSILNRVALTFSAFVSLTKADFCGLPEVGSDLSITVTLEYMLLNRIYDRIIFNLI